MATTNDSPMMKAATKREQSGACTDYAEREQARSMSKQYRDLKAKHPDAMLLFRCGDFYETYEDDARECAKVLGITLTKRQSDGVAMAGFPYHALDTYLPKLVRTGHRIAICDQLDPPPGPKPKRGETIDNSSNNQNSEDEVMTNETKVADLIGKSISNGGNAKYTINSIEGDKVVVTFQMGDSEAKPMTMGVAQVEKLLQGGWQVSDGTAQEPTQQEKPKAKTVKMEPEPKPKAEQPAKPRVTLRKKQPQTETKAEEPKPQGRLKFVTYKNGDKEQGRIMGFSADDEAYRRGSDFHGSAYPVNGVLCLSFSKKFTPFAKEVCQALNEGKTVDDVLAMLADYDAKRAAAKAERDAKREEWKSKREGKTYTEAEVADLMRRVIAGDKEAMAIVNAMAA